MAATAAALLPALIGVIVIVYVLRKLKLLTVLLFVGLGLFAAYAIISLIPELQVEPFWPMFKEFVEAFPQMAADVWTWFKETFGMLVG